MSVEDIFVKKPPFSLNMRYGGFENRCNVTHRVGMYVVVQSRLQYFADLTHAEEIFIAGIDPQMIGLPLAIGVREKTFGHLHASFLPSDLVSPYHPDFAFLHIMAPPALIIHEPAWTWIWPRDGSNLTKSLSPVLEGTSTLDLFGSFSCDCLQSVDGEMTGSRRGAGEDECEIDCQVKLTIDGGHAWQVSTKEMPTCLL